MPRWAVIPARGGSKRIPRKNVREFAGKPMIHWAIEAAREAQVFDKIIVSTDDDEISRYAMQAGALAPFKRPAELSDDFTPTRAVVNHAIETCQALFGPADLVCCLYATSPLLLASDLRAGLALLESSQKSFAFSATSYPYPIQRALRLLPSGGVAMFQPEHFKSRSQDLEPAFHDAGMFYWGRTQAFLDHAPMFSDHARPLLIPSHRVCDLDTEDDWIRAEWIKRAMLLESSGDAR